MKTLMHIEHGRVDIDIAGEGHCELWIVNGIGHRIRVGLYDSSDFAVADIDQQVQYKRILSGGSAHAYWLVRSAAPGELVDVLVEGATSTTLRGREASLVAA